MKQTIPLKFTYRDKEYKGELTSVTGAGSSSLFYLFIDNYFRGQFFYSDSEKRWIFKSNDGMFEDLEDYFERAITSI